MKDFEIKAGKDGLWLSTPSINGVQYCIDLLNKDYKSVQRSLTSIWQQMYNNSDIKPAEPEA